MKEKYTVKEVIFGQREEYIKLQRDLSFLKELCDTNDENIKDFNFRLSNENNIYCDFIIEPNNLKGIFTELLSLLKRNTSYAECVKEEDKIKIINRYYNVFIKPEYMNKFNKIYNEIICSPFINNFNFGYNLCNSFLHYIYAMPTFIDIGFTCQGKKIRYNANIDKLFLEMSDVISNDLIIDFFNYQIPKEMFSEYQREIIESSKVLDKGFIYSLENNQEKSINLSIIDSTSGNITLRKVRR